MRRALFFIALCLWGCSERDRGWAGARVEAATWVPTAGQPLTPREHPAVLSLGDGRVLISGGFNDQSVAQGSTEIYSPLTDSWEPGPPLSAARGRSAVAGDAILGGLSNTARSEGDRYIGDAGFEPLPFLTAARYDAAAVRLPNGALLVMGGTGGTAPLASAELSTSGGSWSGGGTLLTARAGATATLLPSGLVLLAGGVGPQGALASTELRALDGGFVAGPSMAAARVRHTATLLLSGDVLLVGGDGDAGSSAELFVAATSTLRALPSPRQSRAGHTATLLGNGQVVVAGGRGASSAELFDPIADTFTVAGCLLRPRESHGAALSGAGVLLAFGRGDGGVLAHAERFELDGGSALGNTCSADCECASGHCVEGVCCEQACDRGCETCATTGLCRTAPNQRVCRAPASACDAEDTCDGLSPFCADRVADAGVVCRNGTGGCDPGETCSGASPLCPPDLKRPQGFVCRAAVAACDQAEVCDGDGGACPSDALAPATTICRPPAGNCDSPELCPGTSALCPPDRSLAVGTPCRAAVDVCDEGESCTGGPQCPADRFLASTVACGAYACPGDAPVCRSSCQSSADCAADAGCAEGACVPIARKKNYVGFSCAQAGGEAWLLGAAVALLLSMRARRGALLALLLLASSARAATPEPGFFHTGTEGHHGFALRLDLLVLKDFFSLAVGGEAGLTLALSERFDLGGWVSIGRYPGARLGVTLHTRDDGERFRPFLQLRGLVHPVPGGVAAGAGLFTGATAALGHGRLVLGVLFEGYAGPPEYVPAGLYALLGYQWDLYRGPDPRSARIVPPPEPEPVVAAPVGPVAPVAPPPPPPAREPIVESLAEPTPEVAPVQPEPPQTTVVTRVKIREQLFFGERQVKLDPGLKAKVAKVGQALKLLTRVKKLEVAGHADDARSDEMCLLISQRRAEMVLEALVEAGAPRAQLVAKGYGRTTPLVPMAGPPRKREKNRRVEFNVLEMAAP